MSINDRVIETVVYRRLAPILLVLSFLIAIVAAVGTYVNDQAINRANTERINDNQVNAVTACENANESREASRTLWHYVVDLSAAGRKDPTTEQEAAFFTAFRAWIDKVYQPHDCNDLARKYPLPPPPTIPAP